MLGFIPTSGKGLVGAVMVAAGLIVGGILFTQPMNTLKGLIERK
jgi:hypothetical protein